MMTDEIEGAVKWRQEDWQGEDLEYFNQVRSAHRRDISAMRSIRKVLGLSQVETAQILEMTQSNVSKLERGDPSLSAIRHMVEAKGGAVSLKVTAPDGEAYEIAL